LAINGPEGCFKDVGKASVPLRCSEIPTPVRGSPGSWCPSPVVQAHHEYYVEATDDDLERADYTQLQDAHGTRVFAYGRDPYFVGWHDTLQLNHANPATQ
jgi:hypothetical protein